MREVKPSSNETGWEDRLASLTVPEPQPQLQSRLMQIPGTTPEHDGRGRVAPRRFIWWKLGVALSSTAAAGVLFLAVRPRPAFAEVENALRNVRTATWTETWTNFGPEGQEQFSQSSQIWVRVDPPAYARTNPNGFRSLIDGRGGLVYLPPPQDRYSSAPSQGKVVRSMILHSIAVPGTPSGKYRPGFETGQQTLLRGQPAIAFRLRRPSRHGGPTVQETLWADAASHRVLRVERLQLDPQSGVLQYRLIADGYRYDEQPPPGTWDWQLPAGAPVVREDYHSGRPVWSSMPPEERNAIQALISRSDTAWSASDFRAFEAAWDFAGLERFPLFKSTGDKRRESWRVRFDRFKTQALWSSWHSRVDTAEENRSILPLGSLPDTAPPILEVRTTTEITWRDGSRRELTGIYHLAKGPDGYRIIHWSLLDPGWAKVDPKHRAPELGFLW